MKESRYFFVPDAENQTELPTDEAMHAMRNLGFAQKIAYTVLSSDENGLTVKIDMPAYTTSPVQINGQTYQKLQLQGAYALTELGVPELLLSGNSLINPVWEQDHGFPGWPFGTG